eukprot:6211758-Pleurochrysis_carterae.AAC.2
MQQAERMLSPAHPDLTYPLYAFPPRRHQRLAWLMSWTPHQMHVIGLHARGVESPRVEGRRWAWSPAPSPSHAALGPHGVDMTHPSDDIPNIENCAFGKYQLYHESASALVPGTPGASDSQERGPICAPLRLPPSLSAVAARRRDRTVYDAIQ